MTFLHRPSRALLILLAALGFCTGHAQAQTETGGREPAVVLPPALSRAQLIPFSFGPDAELAYHVDAASVALGEAGEAGVVRYVVLAVSRSGAENALYEGLRCTTGEAITYARWNSVEQRWVPQVPAAWRALSGPSTSRVALRLAHTAFCEGRSVNAPVSRMLTDLRRGGKRLGDEVAR